MKKLTNLLVSLMVLTLSVNLAACSSDDDEDSITGYWFPQSYYENNTTGKNFEACDWMFHFINNNTMEEMHCIYRGI